MTKQNGKSKGFGTTLIVLACALVLGAITFLVLTVADEIRAQNSAQSDNVQWSLTQTEVEFQELYSRLLIGEDLAGIRRRFDVFYSRITTLREAKVFEELRQDPEVSARIAEIRAFLDEIVPVIDGSDAALMAGIPELSVLSQDIRPKVRGLATAGLSLFATNADQRRENIARIMTQLAAILALLITALVVGVVYLIRLNNTIVIRERQQAQETERINTIMNTSIDAVIVGDDQGRLTGFNKAAETIFGYKAAEVVGKQMSEVIVPDHLRAAHDAGMERMLRTGEKRVVGKGRVRLEAKRADNSLFPVELAIQSATTEEGEVFVAFLRDVTQQVASEAELIDARDKAIAGEKLRADFLATMSHEIRTPLNGLIGNMSLLRDTRLSTKQDRFLSNMETSGRLLLRHVSDVLEVARFDSGAMNTVLEPMNFSNLVHDIIDNQSGMAAAQGTSLDWSWVGQEQEWILSSPHRLQHILMNLIGNAVKFTIKGSVSVKLAWCDDEVTFDITDTGIGIGADLQSRMFDDFVTGNAAYDRVVDGTGLGLGIVKRSIAALNGSISVKSEEGKGTTFSVRLPAIAATPVSAPEPSVVTPAQPSAPLRVLVVEDNKINRELVHEILASDGHHVVGAHDGQQGVQMAEETLFDLILMDISMPVLDGRHAARKIREGGGASAQTKIVALTAHALSDERADFLAHGMDAVLTKPLTTKSLRRVVAGVAPAQDAARPDLIDYSHNEEMQDLLSGLDYSRLLERYFAELDNFAKFITQSDDFADNAARAHDNAGTSAFFGATALQAEFKNIEHAARNEAAGDMERAIRTLPRVILETRQALLKASR